MKKHVKYTQDHWDFIFANWVDNPELCIEETGHSKASITMKLRGMFKRLIGDIHNGYVVSEKGSQFLVDFLDKEEMTLENFKSKYLTNRKKS